MTSELHEVFDNLSGIHLWTPLESIERTYLDEAKVFISFHLHTHFASSNSNLALHSRCHVFHGCDQRLAVPGHR